MGGRGITVCKSWRETPKKFIQWAEKREYVGLQIDRKNNDLGYYPRNCRFVTPKVQQNNKRPMVLTPGQRSSAMKKMRANQSAEERSRIGRLANASIKKRRGRYSYMKENS